MSASRNMKITHFIFDFCCFQRKQVFKKKKKFFVNTNLHAGPVTHRSLWCTVNRQSKTHEQIWQQNQKYHNKSRNMTANHKHNSKMKNIINWTAVSMLCSIRTFFYFELMLICLLICAFGFAVVFFFPSCCPVFWFSVTFLVFYCISDQRDRVYVYMFKLFHFYAWYMLKYAYNYTVYTKETFNQLHKHNHT